MARKKTDKRRLFRRLLSYVVFAWLDLRPPYRSSEKRRRSAEVGGDLMRNSSCSASDKGLDTGLRMPWIWPKRLKSYSTRGKWDLEKKETLWRPNGGPQSTYRFGRKILEPLSGTK